jgi:tripartite-type tricarboxylate transporter receptor subunit TctC
LSLVAGRLQEQLGQPFVVENIPGTGGGIGVGRLAKMPADGYALGFAHTATFGMGPHLSKCIGYDPECDFTPIARAKPG